MIILTLKSDQPKAELGLYDNQQEISRVEWQAHRELAETIHKKLDQLLNSIKNNLTSQVISNGTDKLTPSQNPSGAVGNRIAKHRDFGPGSSISLNDVGGIVAFRGPGSFTGLRIGLSVANALAYSLRVPIVTAAGKKWVLEGTEKLVKGRNERVAIPEYGALPRVTTPKK